MSNNVHFALAGPKGVDFLTRLIEAKIRPDGVYSYRQKGDAFNSLDRLSTICDKEGIKLTLGTQINPNDDDLTLLIGWQYLVPGNGAGLVVFHDSLLPKHKGYSPTVNALIAGDKEIGVTAFHPDEGMDTGPIISQKGVSVPQFTRIADALSLQVDLMVDLASDIISKWKIGSDLEAKVQSGDGSTYSVWRDEHDYFLDFSQSAERVLRHVRAVGFPYAGARAFLNQQLVVVREAELADDLDFPVRMPGKVWKLDGRGAEVICGSGMIRLTQIEDADGKPIIVSRLRSRLT